jgi:hypothetical protein
MRTVRSDGCELPEIKAARLAEFIMRRLGKGLDPVLITDTPGKDEIAIADFCPGAVSAVIVPFQKHDSLLGAMILYRLDSSKSAKFTQHDLDSLQIFATHASLIIALQHQYPSGNN